MTEPEQGPTVLLGIILPRLEDFRPFVEDIHRSNWTRTTEFTFSAPLYKGTPGIVEDLKKAGGVVDKFDIYFRHAILDETTRQQMAQKFRSQYLARNRRSEGQDVYLASGEVIGFSFELHPPSALPDSPTAMKLAQEYSHDAKVLAAARAHQPVDRSALTGRLKLFLEDPRNRRRRDVPEVQTACEKLGLQEACVFELAVTGALPGLFVAALEPHARRHGGGITLLPG